MPDESVPAIGGDFLSALAGAIGTDMDNEAWSTQQAARLRATVKQVQKADYKEWDWTTLAVWLRREKRLKAEGGNSTLQQRLRDLRRLNAGCEDCDAPGTYKVQMTGDPADIMESFANYVAHREEDEGKAPTAIANDYKAFRLLVAFLGLDPKQLPRPPAVIPPEKEMLPSPEEVRRLLMWEFETQAKWRDYNAALTRYILAFTFWMGCRPPSEVHAMRVDMLDPEHHVIKVKRLKGGGRVTMHYVEPEYLMTGKTTLSMTNWLRWRATRPGAAERPELFLREDGTPFPSKAAFREWLIERVPRDEFPWWHPYIARHWCATARLIEWDFDYERVADWLAHDVEETRQTYDRHARIAVKVHGENWLYRAFQGPPRRGKPAVGNGTLAEGGLATVSLRRADAPAGEHGVSQRQSVVTEWAPRGVLPPADAEPEGDLGPDFFSSSHACAPLPLMLRHR